MMSPGEPLENGGTSAEGLMDKRKQRSGATAYGHTPLQAIHIFGRFMRLWSVYATYQYLTQTGIAIVLFMFICLLSSSAIFLAIQRPWKGRPLSTSQVVASVINGGITALYFVLWGKGLESCGPVRTVLAEYAGAMLGVLSAFLYGRRGHIWKKVGGLSAMIASFYFLSQGWAMTSYSPFSLKGSSEVDVVMHEEGKVGLQRMIIPVFAGILSALRRVVARRVSLKTQWKRRLHAVTIASATCFIFPFAIWQSTFGSNKSEGDNSLSPFWAYSSTVLFGIVLTYYVDAFVEDRLHLIASSPKHLMVTAGCIIVLEVFYRTDFSLLGFLICSSILGLGMFEATSLDRTRRGLVHAENVFTEDFDTSLTRNPLPS